MAGVNLLCYQSQLLLQWAGVLLAEPARSETFLPDFAAAWNGAAKKTESGAATQIIVSLLNKNITESQVQCHLKIFRLLNQNL